MESITWTEKIERYLDCPYCGAFLTDEGVNGYYLEINEGKHKCPSCGKSFHISGED